jgi:splicing factor 3B subunit 3
MGGLPTALAEFNGRLLAGVGRYLRLYELGKKKLLRKCENKHLPNQIVSISSMGTRIVVADQKESVFWVKFKVGSKVFGCVWMLDP